MSVSHLIVSGTGYQSIPVTAGLAVGITFVVLLAFLFSHSTAANNSNNRYEQLDVVLKKSTGDSDSPGYRVSVAETDGYSLKAMTICHIQENTNTQ